MGWKKLERLATQETPKKEYPPLFTVSAAPDPVWHNLLGDLHPWIEEIEQAERSQDRDKRQAGRLLASYFTGAPIDQRRFVAAVAELNPPLLFKVNWNSMREMERK